MKVLICGSGYSISQTNNWDLSTHTVVAVNNAWARVKWNYFCCPADYQNEYNKSIGFPPNVKPVKLDNLEPNQNWYNQDSMMYAVARSGGWAECGQTTILAAAYCITEHFKTHIESIGFIGCDLVYNTEGDTAYYGVGIDFQKRNVSDPDHMAAFERKSRADEMHPLHNKRWRDLSNDEIIQHFFNRLSTFVKDRYGISVYNYSNLETRLPYERKTYI
ncbi:hypothetical protein OAU13_01055 [bacterium]|nr:hypothetical protein [bacterium]